MIGGYGNKKGAFLRRRRLWRCWCRRCSAGSQRFAGALSDASEGVGVVHGDVGQDLAVELHVRELEAMDELRVGEAVLARGRVDARDPQAAEVALAVAAIAVAVLVGL